MRHGMTDDWYEDFKRTLTLAREVRDSIADVKLRAKANAVVERLEVWVNQWGEYAPAETPPLDWGRSMPIMTARKVILELSPLMAPSFAVGRAWARGWGAESRRFDLVARPR